MSQSQSSTLQELTDLITRQPMSMADISLEMNLSRKTVRNRLSELHRNLARNRRSQHTFVVLNTGSQSERRYAVYPSNSVKERQSLTVDGTRFLRSSNTRLRQGAYTAAIFQAPETQDNDLVISW
jgi:hypothetical protein